MGESEVPVNPQRVVVLDTGELDNALALGAAIIGAPVAEAREYQAYLADQLDGITDTGAISEPSLETILTLKPDLILGSKQRHEALYEQLSAIAPTVFTESLRVPWQDNFNLHAEALGKSAEAETLLTAYAARTSAIKAALGANPPTISIIRFRPGQVRLYLKSSYIGYILQDVGLPRPPAQDQDSFSSEISLEQVADVDADYILITGYAQDDSDQDAFLKSELWTTLGGVQSGHAIDVDDDTWIAGLGVQSANLVLDDLINILDLAIDEATTAPATAAFPVTLEHKYGSTTITEEPKRVVTVGLTDQDALLALGIVPVGTSEWFGGYPGSIWPWAQDELAALGGAIPAAVGGESINMEKIAALQPDLILALYSGLKQEEYDLLRQIAPTVAQPRDYVDYGIPWQELTLTVGKAVGKADEAQALIAGVEAQFAQIQVEHPEFTGATSIVATPYQGIWVYGEQDVRGRFLTMLGFQLPAGLQEVTGTEFGGNLSLERADLLDVDVIIWLDAEEADGELGGPVYQKLPVHTEGREVLLSSYDDPLGGATSFVSVLSLPYLLDNLVPMLVAALDSAPTKAAALETIAAADTRTITDAKDRQVEVPSQPVRIVALTELDLDSALALGITPVGSVNGRGQTGLPAYLGDKAAGIVSVGTLAEPSLEAIVALDPDLILAGSMIEQIEALLPQLSEIAPVVATYKPTDDWKSAFQSIATVLNQESAAATFLGEYEQRVATIKALLPTDKATEANVARWMPQGPVVMMPAIFSSLVLADVGITRPAAIAELAGSHGAHTDPLSLEALDLLDSEWLFLGALNPEGVSALDAALDNPLFQQLSVVQNNQVVVVDGAVWTSIGGPLAALVVLDDIEAALQP